VGRSMRKRVEGRGWHWNEGIIDSTKPQRHVHLSCAWRTASTLERQRSVVEEVDCRERLLLASRRHFYRGLWQFEFSRSCTCSKVSFFAWLKLAPGIEGSAQLNAEQTANRHS
jgi:hypothetical protein